MDSSLSLTTRFSPQFTISKVHMRPFCVVFPPTFHRRLRCASSSIHPSRSDGMSSPFGRSESYHNAIILDVQGMTSSTSAVTIKRILENHPQVYVATINQNVNSTIVWPVPEAKVGPNWQKQLGEELAKYLTSCGFKTELQDLNAFHGSLKSTPYSVWGDDIISSLAPLDSESEHHAKEVEALKVRVKDLFLDSAKELTKNIEFLNLLCRLGLSYHFENEIDENLQRIFTMLPKLLEDNDYDLCTTANLFRLLRQYGYNLTCDVFEKFKDENGDFKKDLANDLRGILCLYEASFLAIPGEDTLDEALSFSRKHLHVLADNTSNLKLQKYIRTALTFPSHWNAENIDALYFISYYQEDISANQILLRFAKLNFNRLQLICRKELAMLWQWWMDTKFTEHFPYIRDRFMEANLWSIGCITDPKYHLARMIITKYTVLVTLIDDTYDTYGSTDIEQLQHLTTALRSMTEDGSDVLPECMKNIYKILFEDLESNCTKGCSSCDNSEISGTKGLSYKTIYLSETIKMMARHFMVEATWRNEQKVPSFDEYIEHAKKTTAYEAFAAMTILGIENLGMKEILWVQSCPKIVDACEKICRLINDITGQKDAKERRDFPKSIDCYMKQYGVSEDEAIEALQKMINDEWKVMNEEMLNMKASNIPKILIKFTLNYARMLYVVNGPRDGYTYSSYLKELVNSMLVEPLPM